MATLSTKRHACYNREPFKSVVISKQFPGNQHPFRLSLDCKYSIEHGKKDANCRGCKWNQAETAERRLQAIKDSKYGCR